MKKLLIILIIIIVPTLCFATTALYRISSGEVTAISVTDEELIKDIYHTSVSDATYPDGTEFLDSNGEWRVLGYSKIYDSGTVRNSTQQEIDGFAAAKLDDENQIDADRALEYLKNHPEFRKIMIAVFNTLIEHEFNEYRTWFTDFQSEVAASTSLADFKTRMATLPAMPQRQLSQLKTQVENRINKDD